MQKTLNRLILLPFLIFTMSGITQITFEKTIGTPLFERAKSIKQTPDGGYIIGGTNLVKINETGGLEWTKPYPSNYANTTNDGGYILVQSSSPNIIFTKVNANGDTLWQTNNSDGVWANEGFYIEQTKDSGFIVTGRYQSVTGSGMLLLKLNKQGNKMWRRAFSEATSAGFSTGYAVIQTADRGYILSGSTKLDYYDSTRHNDVFIVKTDSLGTEQWRRFFGGTEDDVGYCVQQDSDQNYLIAGRTDSYGIGASSDMYLIKLDPNGDSLWTQIYGGQYMETATGLWFTTDGGYILSGSSNTFSNGDFDGYIVKTNNNGDTLWTKHYGRTGIESLNSVQQSADNGYIFAGSTNSFGAGSSDMYIIKTDSLGQIQSPNGISKTSNAQLSSELYPNPSTGIFNIKTQKAPSSITILNLLGQSVFEKVLNPGDVKIDLSKYQKGTYFYQIKNRNAETIKTGKIIIQ